MFIPWVNTMTIQQGADFWAKKDSTQTMDITVEDGEDGAYVVLKTSRWALTPEELPDFCSWLKKICRDADNNAQKFLNETHFPAIVLPDDSQADNP